MQSKPFAVQLQQALQSANWPVAKALLTKAAQDTAATAPVFYNLGKVLEANCEYQQSGAWFEKAVNAMPEYAIAWFELGRWAINHKHYPKALNAFLECTELTPDDTDAWRNLARTALRCGDWATAERAWQRFDDTEAKIARYRVQVELGNDGKALLSQLLSQADCRLEVLRAMTRTARGSIPLRVDPLATSV